MKIKLKKEQLRKEMKRMKLTYDEIARITGVNRNTIVSAFSDSQTRICIDQKEFEQILCALNGWENTHMRVIRKWLVKASDVSESV